MARVAPQPPASAGASRKSSDEIGPGQDRADDLALHADAAAMDDAQGLESQAPRLSRYPPPRLHIARRDGVQVEDVGDRNSNGLRHIQMKKPGPERRTGPTGITVTART